MGTGKILFPGGQAVRAALKINIIISQNVEAARLKIACGRNNFVAGANKNPFLGYFLRLY